MSLAYRPLVAQIARDALARWTFRATGLTPYAGDGNAPRPGLPYVSLTFPRSRTFTGSRRLIELAETIGPCTVTITAGEGEPVSMLANSARPTLTRGVGETAPALLARLVVEVGWWLRGRATVAAVGADLVVTPLAPGLLVRLEAIEGCTVDEGEPGPAARRLERLYRTTCRVQVLGAPLGAAVGAVGDGLDAYTIEAALREGLTDQATLADLRGAYLVPHGLPDGEPSYASAVSGALRETRLAFDLEFGWTGFYVAASEALLLAQVSMGLAPESGEEQEPVILTLP